MANGVKAKKRVIHVTFQTLGGCFTFMGLTFVVANKIMIGKTVIPHTVHSVLGTLTVVGVLVQVIVGQMKTTHSLPSAKQQRYGWHGKLGLLTYDVGMLSMVTGLLWWSVTIPSVVLAFLLVAIWISVCVHFGYNPPDVVATDASDEKCIELMASEDGFFQSPTLITSRKPPPRHMRGPPAKFFTVGPSIFEET